MAQRNEIGLTSAFLTLLLGLCLVAACTKDPKAAEKEKEIAHTVERLAEMEADVVKYDKKIQDAGSDHGLVIQLKAEQDSLKSRVLRLKTHLPKAMLEAGKSEGGGHH